jgi:hypothetical protein
MRAIDVTLYTRPTCQRTISARETLERARRRFPLLVREVDVSADIALELAYGKDTPVVLIEGAERFRRQVDENELKIILQTLQMQKRQLRRRHRDQ